MLKEQYNNNISHQEQSLFDVLNISPSRSLFQNLHDFDDINDQIMSVSLPQESLIHSNVGSLSKKEPITQNQLYQNSIRRQNNDLHYSNAYQSIHDPQITLQKEESKIKQEIKTFPNFIFRVFESYFTRYTKNVPSLKQEVFTALQQFIKGHSGSKHYTLRQLCDIFMSNEKWSCKINRVILNHILNRFGYRQIFTNHQRKMKKTYLIMSKVYKLRCRNQVLCSRVQCQ